MNLLNFGKEKPKNKRREMGTSLYQSMLCKSYFIDYAILEENSIGDSKQSRFGGDKKIIILC
jgi:hypothetical protein